MRLIDADAINFEEVFIGASDFAKDTRGAAQELVNKQPTAFDLESVIEQVENIMNDDNIRFCDQAVRKVVEILKSATNGGTK